MLLTDPQIMLLLMRCCVLPTVTHLLRTCLPTEVEPFCRPFDEGMLRALTRAIHLPAQLPAGVAAVVQLPLRHGGFGFTPTAAVRPAAFIAGTLFALDALSDVDAGWRVAVEAFVEGLVAPAEPVEPLSQGAPRLAAAMLSSHADVLRLMPLERREVAGYHDELTDNLSATAGLQRRLMRAHATHRRDGVRSDLEMAGIAGFAPADALARQRQEAWEAAASRGGTDYLAVMPDVHVAGDTEEETRQTGGHFALDAAQFRLTVCLHLGLPCPQVPVSPPLICPCAANYGGARDPPPPPHPIDIWLRVLSACTGSYGA